MYTTHIQLFQTTKIQIFESNSQLYISNVVFSLCCFRQQRYKFLKAIHNLVAIVNEDRYVVSDNKDTNF